MDTGTRIELNNDAKKIEEVKNIKRQNGGKCPLSSTGKCICEEFLIGDTGMCRSGLYIKTNF